MIEATVQVNLPCGWATQITREHGSLPEPVRGKVYRAPVESGWNSAEPRRWALFCTTTWAYRLGNPYTSRS